jgi:flagellar basal body L-ring protein FlgH
MNHQSMMRLENGSSRFGVSSKVELHARNKKLGRATAGGREIGKRTISHSLQALKKQGRVRIRGGKWMLLNARSKPASA